MAADIPGFVNGVWDQKTQLGQPGSTLWSLTSPYAGKPTDMTEDAWLRVIRQAAEWEGEQGGTPAEVAARNAHRDQLLRQWLGGDRSVGMQAVPPAGYVAGGGPTGTGSGTWTTGSGGVAGVPGTPTFTPSGGTAGQNDAYVTLKKLLDQYGLSDLSQWAWDELLQNRSANEIALSLLDQPAYESRFGKVIKARRASGLPPVSAAEIVSYENSWNQVAKAGGLPDTFASRDTAQTLLANNVSVAEASERVQRGFAQVQQAPIEVRAAFDSFFGAQSDSALASLFLDADIATPELEKRVSEAQAAGSATMHGFSIDAALARRLADAGVSFDQAQAGFGVMAEHRSLFDESVSENTDLTTQQGVEGQFGLSSASAEAVQRRSEARRAAYAGSGQATETQTGITGLGSARQT